MPKGSAPADKVHKPNPVDNTPGQSYPESKKETWTYATDTLTGSEPKADGGIEFQKSMEKVYE